MNVTLLAITKPTQEAIEMGICTPDLLVEFAGRLCYASENKLGTNPHFIHARIREGHRSIIEHGAATFLVEEISRVTSHQLVRHRIASYSQQSQRYVDQGNNGSVIPGSFPSELREDVLTLVTASKDLYDKLRDRGVRKEDARYILPEGSHTKLVVTMNFASWLHFLEIRLDKAAQWEIREVAEKIHSLLKKEAPLVFADVER